MNSKKRFESLDTIPHHIFEFRVVLLAILLLLSIFLGHQAYQLEVATDFSRMVPQDHSYIQAYQPFKQFFGGGNQIRMDVAVKEGTVVNTQFLKQVQKITEDVMFIKGVDRLKVRSIVSPETRYVLITEDGFNMGPVVPARIPEDEAGLARIQDNINQARLKGRMVSMDMKSVLISAEIYETGVDYHSVYNQLNDIRGKYSDDNISIHINGFAMVMGFVTDALPKTVGLFLISALITFMILWRCFRSIRLAILPLICSSLAVLWSLGIARMVGIKLDPMTTLVPFLVFAIGVSHGIQMIKRYQEQCLINADGYYAAFHALSGLMVPGVIALATDCIGFLTIMFIPILVIQDLAITASIGIACIIIANTIALSLFLSFLPNPCRQIDGSMAKPAEGIVFDAMKRVSTWTYGKNAYRVAILSFLLLLIGSFAVRTTAVGDVNPGEPLLWEESVYNQDAAKIMKDFMLGVDTLSVVVAHKEQSACKNYEIVRVMEDYEEEIGQVPGVTFVFSPLMIGRAVNEMLHEGDIRWRSLPKESTELGALFAFAGSTDDTEFMNMGCQAMNIRIFLSDHKGDTIRSVISKTKEFIATNPLPEGAEFVLAGGNVGVMAATNEEVADAQVPMLFWIYLSIFVLCTLIFRDLKAAFFIIAPLALVSLLATAFMNLFGLGLNVNTLPVAALGVGIGVDYGIYIYSRLKSEMKSRDSFQDAVEETLTTTGIAVLYTALTLSAGVITWLLSDLKFQADMGLLLSFIFFTNMIGATVLLPTLVYLFDYRKRVCA